MKLTSVKTGIFFIVIILTILSLNFFQKSVRNFFFQISAPFQRSLWQTGGKAAIFLKSITSAGNLEKENDALKIKIQELLSEKSSLLEAEKENVFLREAFGLGLEKEFKLEFAEVISKDIFQDSILINKGSSNGLAKNMPVITPQKVLVGKVTEVFQNFSQVSLVSKKDVSFDARIMGDDIFGVARGKGNFQLSLELIPKEKNINEGGSVVTAVLGGIFPANLLVGEIKKTDKSDVKPFQSAEINPAFSESKLERLLIITDF